MDRDLQQLRMKHPEFNDEQIAAIRTFAANYALAALMDSKVRKEAEAICQEQVDPADHHQVVS